MQSSGRGFGSFTKRRKGRKADVELGSAVLTSALAALEVGHDALQGHDGFVGKHALDRLDQLAGLGLAKRRKVDLGHLEIEDPDLMAFQVGLGVREQLDGAQRRGLHTGRREGDRDTGAELREVVPTGDLRLVHQQLALVVGVLPRPGRMLLSVRCAAQGQQQKRGGPKNQGLP